MEKEIGDKDEKQTKEPPEIVAIELDEESDAAFVIVEDAMNTSKQSAGTGEAEHPASADTSATPLATGLQSPMAEEQE